MSVFRDESGVRGHAVRAASVLGAAVAVAALGVFLVSIFPAPWSQSAFEPERAPVSRGVLPAGHPLESKARERVYRNEAARLKTLLTEAHAAQRLARLCEERGFAGVNLDFEDLDPRLWQEFAAFVESAWTELHPRGFVLSADVPAETRGVPIERLAAATDFLVVMAYDQHASTDNPGPIATPDYVAERAAAYLRRAPGARVGVPLGPTGFAVARALDRG